MQYDVERGKIDGSRVSLPAKVAAPEILSTVTCPRFDDVIGSLQKNKCLTDGRTDGQIMKRPQ